MGADRNKSTGPEPLAYRFVAVCGWCVLHIDTLDEDYYTVITYGLYVTETVNRATTIDRNLQTFKSIRFGFKKNGADRGS